MLIWNEIKRSGPGLPAARETDSAEDGTEGMFATTRIATPFGWRQAGAIRVGDMVLTHDAGLQPVVRVRHVDLSPGLAAKDPSEWPLFVPRGSIGNTSDMFVMPGQWLLLESRLSERLLGAAHVLIRAADMDSAMGILRVAPSDGAVVSLLEFEDDQIIFGAGGALISCRGQNEMLESRARGMYHNYRRLTPAEAHLILSQDVLPLTGEPAPRLA